MSGIRFSPFSSAQQPQQQVPIMKVPPKPKQYQIKNSISGSDTDVSTSNENLSKEERYVLKHTARVEPQGQENLSAGKVTPVNDISPARLPDNQQQLRFSSNTSSDSTTRYATPTSQRSVSEARNAGQHDSNRSSLIASTNSNRNSLKETNSNRSSMDVSQSSYNTLIIHNDDCHEYSSPPPYGSVGKKDRPRSYGERQDVEEYLNQSQVLKHLAKEVKLPRAENTRDSGVSENDPPRYPDDAASKLKSKSQPDLTYLETEYEDIEALVKENTQLKEQLTLMYHKLAKTQKLQQEITNIQHDYEAMIQSNERREKLELTARGRLQNEVIRLQEVNRALRDQNEALQNQLLTLPDHSMGRNQDALLQLAAQNKELAEANKRQYIEIQAQNVTLDEQRAHIHFLDTALKRLQDESRQKQIYVDRCAQLQHVLQSLQNASERRENAERKMLLDSFEKGDTNANAAQDANLKWQLREKDNQIMRLEAECAKLEQRNVEDTRNASKLNVENQETERAIAEAKQEKLRYLDEVHTTNRKVDELQTKLKLVEGRLAEKETMIRSLQKGQKVYSGNSFGSYNLSSDYNIGYNSQTSFDVSNNSFDVSNPTVSLLDANTYGPSSSSASISTTYSPGYGQTNPTYNQSAINLQTINYSPVTSNYKPHSTFTQSSTNLDPIYDSYDARRIDEQLKQLDEALLSKRGLCCLPGLGNKKASLLGGDNSAQLSSNNSETLLTSLKQIDHRSRSRSNQEPENKGEEMMLLVKQGVTSQKTRNNTVGNLAQVTQNVGQNMTDISNIGQSKRSPSPSMKAPQIVLASNLPAGILPPRKDRGNSLPPPLPRPPRSLKPPRKIEYGRLEADYCKKRSQTPPTPQQEYEMKSSTIKRSDYKRALAETMKFGQKHKNYGAIFSDDKFGFKQDYSTRNYQRLDEPPRKVSLIPNPRKEKSIPKNGSRDSLNSASSGSNNSNNSNTPVRSSPNHIKTDSNSSTSTYQRNLTPPTKSSFIASAKNKIQQFNQKSSSLPSSSTLHKKASTPTFSSSASTTATSSASLPPPKPSDNKGQQRRGHSLARGENRYRIMQF